jgi:hypothetical protein
MRNSNRQKVREWWYALRVAIPTLIVLLFLDIPMKWKHTIGATVMVFYVVIIFSRNNWKNRLFWIGLSALFLLHAAGFTFLNLSLPEKSMGFRGFPLIIFSMLEAVFICGALNRLCNRNSLSQPQKQSTIKKTKCNKS